MDAKETIKALLEASEDGTITAEQVTQAGLHRSVLQELVKSGELYRFGRGLYVRSGIWEDELYLLQRKYGRGIYSMETALYLHGYSDRAPAQYTMTFPKGYNTPSLKQENVTIKWVQQLNYPLGIILSTDKTNVEAEYALGELSNNIFTSRYTYVIPNKDELIAQVEAVLREWHEPESDGDKED